MTMFEETSDLEYGEVTSFLNEVFGIKLDKVCRIYARIRGIDREYYITCSELSDLINDLNIANVRIQKIGIKILVLRKDMFIPTSSLAQLYGDKACRNIVEAIDRCRLEYLMKHGYIGGFEGFKEYNSTDYPFKILKYCGYSIGIVKRAGYGYISLLPTKFSEVRLIPTRV